VLTGVPIPLAFIRLENDQRAEALDMRGYFTTMTTASTKVWPVRQVALLTTQDEDGWELITEVGILTRSVRRVATGWHRLHYQRQYELEPLDLEGFVAAVSSRLRSSVESRTGVGALTPKASAEVLKVLAKLRPGAASTLRRLVGRRQRRGRV
jgi:hypothetical protein